MSSSHHSRNSHILLDSGRDFQTRHLLRLPLWSGSLQRNGTISRSVRNKALLVPHRLLFDMDENHIIRGQVVFIKEASTIYAAVSAMGHWLRRFSDLDVVFDWRDQRIDSRTLRKLTMDRARALLIREASRVAPLVSLRDRGVLRGGMRLRLRQLIDLPRLVLNCTMRRPLESVDSAFVVTIVVQIYPIMVYSSLYAEIKRAYPLPFQSGTYRRTPKLT